MERKEINHACSFGTLCHSSNMLKYSKLKKCSYPFDWIFSNYDIILHCIEDEFKIFLDKSYYHSIHNNACEHTYYFKKGSGTVLFYHRNPLKNIEHYKYYERCVNRFKNLLKNSRSKLFTIFYHNRDNVDENIKNEVIEFNEKLSKYTTNYTILVVFNIHKKPIREHFFTQHENSDFLELHTVSSSNGVVFFNNDDNNYLGDILKSKYNFILDNVE